MKKLFWTLLTAGTFTSVALNAQNNPTTGRDNPAEPQVVQPVKPNEEPVKPVVAPAKPDDTVTPDKDKDAQIRHAEERSKGHAFSGKGEGGDKNLVDPQKKTKKNKKAKKSKKADKSKAPVRNDSEEIHPNKK
jgi:hypothetical protein